MELDGDGHYTLPARTYDSERRIFLEKFGIIVIRFENQTVFRDEEWVLDRIRHEFGKSS